MTTTTLRSGTGGSLLLDANGLAGLRVRQACRELELTCLTAPAPDEAPETLVARASKAGCLAVHPGEADMRRQLALALACRQAGLDFIGPRSTLIEAMLDGRAVQQLMREAGLPLAEATGTPKHEVRVPVLSDGQGRALSLPPRHRVHPALTMAPVDWLTPEQRAYLGQLAVQGVVGLGIEGQVILRFRVVDNRIGFSGMAPGLDGSEALDEVLIGLDPVVETLRLAAGGRLRDRQEFLAPRGQALLWQLFPERGAHFSGGPGLRLDRCADGDAAGRLLAWGRTLDEARRRGRRGLEELLAASALQALWAGAEGG